MDSFTEVEISRIIIALKCRAGRLMREQEERGRLGHTGDTLIDQEIASSRYLADVIKDYLNLRQRTS